MIALVAFWSHLAAGLLYGGLAAWQARHWRGDVLNRPLVAAFAATAAWGIAVATAGPFALVAILCEVARNLAFLTFMYGIVQAAEGDAPRRAIRYVYAAVAGTVGFQAITALMTPFIADPEAAGALLAARHSLGLTVAAGGLVLVHNLYARAARGSRWSIRYPAIALGALWAYDLHLYTVTYLAGRAFADLFALRGAFAVLLAPLFAAAMRRNSDWRIKLSRSVTFRWLSLLAILGYFAAMLSASRMMGLAEGGHVRLAQVALIFGMTCLALVLLPSGRARAWLHVMIAKHLFEHRYDYREDWLRFSRTLGRAGDDPLPVEERVVKALAEMAGSPGGLLFRPEEGRLILAARWNWAHAETPAGPLPEPFRRFLTDSGFIIDFGARHDGPAWLGQQGAAWAGVPLIHNGQLVGLVLLDHPVPRRPLDWEDFDLFRTAGIQAASYLAEAQGQEALNQARRFDEFNRRFAFIMHDIKNLVSQLSLVARNAERHADNPEFRADMVATLQSSVKKMNDLLAKLAGASGGAADRAAPVPLRKLLDEVAKAKRRRHPIEAGGDPAVAARADWERLEQALLHLVQNAIEATADDAPVRLSCARAGAEALIEVADEGMGMSPDFVRTRLFQPFASTKPAGFGIGAFEARTLIASMGGRLEVDSREGRGTRFTIHLPAADAAAEPQRISA